MTLPVRGSRRPPAVHGRPVAPAHRWPVLAALARPLVVAIAIALVGVPALAPEATDAATPGLTIVGAATYDVLPDTGRIAVSVVLTATNHLKDTVARRVFFRTLLLTVLPGTSGFRVTGGIGKPKVSVSKKTATYTNLKIDLGANLAAGKTTTLTLTFDIKESGSAPDRQVRISRSLVSFAAWAFATPQTPGASVTVRLPSGYTVTIGRGPLQGPLTDATGHDTWSSGPIQAPLSFVADIVADLPTDYVETSSSVPLAAGPATVLLRSWPDDLAWRDRVGALVARALPILEREIGVPWPIGGPLAIHEAVVRSSGGYAGVFDPRTSQIEIAYAASDGVVLHELAHAWFNGRLVADRWEAEAFASYYADLAARELGLNPSDPVPPAEPGNWAIPLNAWGPSGSVPAASEAWAYVASLDLARLIAERAGADTLRGVWSAAARGVAAYQPDPTAEEVLVGPPDWRGLLDLLEDRTGKSFSDLWTAHVARPSDIEALGDRAVARGAYIRLVALAGEWRLPPTIRAAMRAWRFDLARQLLLAADGVQAQRLKLEASAAAAKLTLPARLRDAFESGAGLDVAAEEATAEQAIVDAITAARAAEPIEHGVGERLIIAAGLFTSDPAAQLDRAAAALAAGDISSAYNDATDAGTAWRDTAAVGRSRILSFALLLLALGLFAGLVRQRRRAPTVGRGG